MTPPATVADDADRARLFAARRRAPPRQDLLGRIRRGHGDDAPFARQIIRVVAQDGAEGTHGVADRNAGFGEAHAEARRRRDFVRDRRESAARRIAHEAQAIDRGERRGQRRHGRAIRLDGSLQLEFLAREHHGDAVIADRPADEQHVARADPVDT